MCYNYTKQIYIHFLESVYRRLQRNMSRLQKEYVYKYPHAAITADCVIYGFDGERLKILLVERGIEPYKGQWALPGGFMKIDESIEETARRELEEETGLRNVFMTQFKVFSSIDRDPRERVVTVVFMTLVRPSDYQLVAGDDAANALWFDERYLPPLAFDHEEIISETHRYLEELIRLKPVAFELLNKTFSLGELQRVYEEITGKNYDRRNFQRKAVQSGLIVPVSESKCLDSSYSDDFCDSNSEILTQESVMPTRPGRKPNRRFTLSKACMNVESDDSDSSDASIRDLFSF